MRNFLDVFLDEMSVEELKQLSKKTDLGNDSAVFKIYNEVINLLRDENYSDAVDDIKDMSKDPKLRFILSLGFGGKFADYKLKVNKTVIKANVLMPTQNEIGFDETLKYLCKGDHIDDCFKPTVIVKKPIVTFKGIFIIDGHHRWSEIYVTNPEARMVTINIDGDLSPIHMLKVVQATIGSNQGKLFSKDVKGRNLLTASEDSIRMYINENITAETIEKLKKYYNEPIEELIKNCKHLKNNNAPIINAPDRSEMPQTGKDPELFNDLKQGVTKV